MILVLTALTITKGEWPCNIHSADESSGIFKELLFDFVLTIFVQELQ